jgi:hypothetical protein
MALSKGFLLRPTSGVMLARTENPRFSLAFVFTPTQVSLFGVLVMQYLRQ